MEVKDNLQGINSRTDEARDQSNDMEYKEIKNNQSEQQQEKRIQETEDSVRSLWDFKQTNICIIGVSEGEQSEKEIGNLFEKLMKEKFPYLVKEIDMQARKHKESQTRWVQTGTLRHTIIKIPKCNDKERILKLEREKQLVSYRGILIRLSADFAKETLQARRN